MNSKVEKRHKLFAQEYVIDFNGRRAAIAAGYGETRAEVTASELLKVPRVMALIDNLQSQRASKLELKGEQVVEELRNIAFSNMLDYMTPHKDGRAAARLLESNTRAGRSNSGSKTRQPQRFRRQGNNPHDFQLADKLKALELLGKYLALYPDHGQGEAKPVAVQIVTNVRLDAP
jgi:phage terminase small subunit